MAKRPRRDQQDSGADGTSQGFEKPGGNGGSGADPEPGRDTSAFEAPSDEAMGAEAVASESAAIEAELHPDIVALKREIDGMLAGNARIATEAASVQGVDASCNIIGAGFGSGDARAAAEASANLLPGEPALIVYTIEKVPTEHVVAEIASAAGTQALSTVPVIQVPVGIVDAYPHRMRMRPAPGGISVAHFKVTAGTLGCLCIGAKAPRNNRLMILSNNHVLANSNGASLGDCICQPGPADAGSCPADQIAILEMFVPINFSGGINYVDCATGWAWPDRVRRELMYLSGGSPVFFRVGSAPVAAAPGMIVGKTGRTTQLRQGRVSAVNVTVNVNYGSGRIGHFRDQIAITGIGGDFSLGGDSGSLIWQWDAARRPVGLLFAGGGGTTFGNRITRVLQALDVALYT